MRMNSIDKLRSNVFLLVPLAILLCSNVTLVLGDTQQISYLEALPVAAENPKVILQSGTAGSSIIYTNDTSARVSVSALLTSNLISNGNFTSDASEWVYGEVNDVDNFADGFWSSTGGRNDAGCYDLYVDDTSPTKTFDVNQTVDYSFTINAIPSEAIIYAAYKYTSDDDAEALPKIQLVKPDDTVVDVYVGSWVTLAKGSDTGYIYVTPDATAYFTVTGNYKLRLFTNTRSIAKASDKATVNNYWDDVALIATIGASTYDHVLKVVNQVTRAWNISLKVYDSSNTTRLSNTTISFHDGTTSDQIIVNNGTIEQPEGSLYDLAGSATIYISISNLQANKSGTSYLYVYLKILVPGTSTYALLKITFEIT